MNKINKNTFKYLITMFAILSLIPELNVLGGSGDWGLSYTSKGSTPVGNETKDYLEKFDAYFVGDTEDNKIYLTFDAGYENGYTEGILDILKEKEVPATFFLVGTYIRDNPELINRMVKEGHIVGNHTMSHPDMSAISKKEAFIKEIAETEEVYKSIVGEDMLKLYRPPRGKYSQSNMEMAKELGYKTIFWSLAYVDWNDNSQPTKEQAFSKLIPRIHQGAILLLHNTSKTNLLILEELIDKYEELGFEFESLDNLIV